MKTSIRSVTFVILSIAASVLSTAMAHTDGGVVIKDVLVREAPPNAPVLAAYLTVENHTSTQKVLSRVTSPNFSTIEFHRTEHQQDVARMVRQMDVTIPAEGETRFAPGGLHLMLIKPNKSFRAGDSISLTFTFADGSVSVVSAMVKKLGGGMDHSQHSGNHQDHADSHADHHTDKPAPEHDNHHDPEHNDNHHSH